MAACHDCVLIKPSTHATTALMLSTCYTRHTQLTEYVENIYPFCVFCCFFFVLHPQKHWKPLNKLRVGDNTRFSQSEFAVELSRVTLFTLVSLMICFSFGSQQTEVSQSDENTRTQHKPALIPR
jgi:hypothetical protein